MVRILSVVIYVPQETLYGRAKKNYFTRMQHVPYTIGNVPIKGFSLPVSDVTASVRGRFGAGPGFLSGGAT